MLVGAFVLTLGAALIAGVLWLASGGSWQKQYDLYLAVVDESVAGLNLNAPVKYNGVDVGKVQDITLDSANPQQVRLLFAIEYGAPIREDTVAVLKTQGLTGIAYVELSVVRPTRRCCRPSLAASTPRSAPNRHCPPVSNTS
jgi:phospholipid/cholesterol/gamma-HCH transport system substrate-binding protein